jgi:hypothetical protein
MITYLFWFMLFSILVLIGLIAYKTRFYKTGAIVGGIVFLSLWSLYYFKWEQHWVKNLGGTMTISVPKGMIHLGTTWKDENIWIENYDPKTNTCYFTEYSKGHLLEGNIIIKRCNPALPAGIVLPQADDLEAKDLPQNDE